MPPKKLTQQKQLKLPFNEKIPRPSETKKIQHYKMLTQNEIPQKTSVLLLTSYRAMQ